MCLKSLPVDLNFNLQILNKFLELIHHNKMKPNYLKVNNLVLQNQGVEVHQVKEKRNFR